VRRIYHSQLARFCVSAVLAAWLLRLMVVAFTYEDFLDPSRNHWEFGFEIGQIAATLASGHGFQNPYYAITGPTAIITPVYPYLYAGVFALLGVKSKASALTILGLNTLFSALTCVPIFFVARRTLGVRVAKLSVWFWVFFPYAIYFSAVSMWYHSFLALLLTTLFLLALYLEAAASMVAWVGFGLLAGILALTSPVSLTVLPVLLGWPCYRRYRSGAVFVSYLSAAVISLLAVISPWLVRNYRTFHQPVFLKDNFWMEVCVGNVGNSLHWWNGAMQPSGSEAELARFKQLGETRYLALKRQQALTFIQGEPGIYLWRCARRIIFLWTGFWSFGREYLRQEPLDPWNVFFCSAYNALVLLGLRKLARAVPATALPFGLLMLLYPCVYYLTQSAISYRLPIDPEGVILASYFLVGGTSRE